MASVTFDPEHWNEGRCITIQLLRDGIVPSSSPVPYNIDYLTQSNDNNYQGVEGTTTIKVINIDSYSLSYNNATTKLLEGETGYITVRLQAKPTSGSLSVSVTSSDNATIKPTVNSITFNSSNWESGVRVGFKAINNNIVDAGGKRTAYLIFEASAVKQ